MTVRAAARRTLPPPNQVIATPNPRRRLTTVRSSPSRLPCDRSRPPSNRMIATAMLTSGVKAAPKIFSGSTAVIRLPAANPIGNSKMIAGMPNFAATI